MRNFTDSASFNRAAIPPLMKSLARLEGVSLRGWLTAAQNDLRFAAALIIIVIFGVLVAYQTADRFGGVPWAGPGLATLTGFLLYRLFWLAPGSPGHSALLTGPFQPWTSFGEGLRQWIVMRASAMTITSLLVLSLPVACARPVYAPAFIGCGILGASLRAVMVLRPALTKPKRLLLLLFLPKLRLAQPSWLSRSLWIVLSNALRRKIGPFPRWLPVVTLWGLSALIANLTARNNHDPYVGFAVVSLAGLACAIALSWPDLPLLRFLSHQPIPVRRLVITLYAPTATFIACAALAAAVIAGLSVALAVASTAFVVGLTVVWLGLLLPYGMMQSPHGAPGFALRDIGIAIAVKFAFQFGILAVGWLIWRIAANIRSVHQKRWRENL